MDSWLGESQNNRQSIHVSRCQSWLLVGDLTWDLPVTIVYTEMIDQKPSTDTIMQDLFLYQLIIPSLTAS